MPQDIIFLFFFKGLLIGFAIAAPVGPIGVLCIRRTLAYGRRSGLASGLGAATADALYGCVAAFGLTVISHFLIHQQFWLRFGGGGFLLYLGARTFLSRPGGTPPAARRLDLAGDYFSTFFLTLANPLTILAFAVIFAGLGLGTAGGTFFEAGMLVAGVFLGSALWWWILSFGIGAFRNRFNPRGLRWINRISGLIILGFGVARWLLLSGFFSFRLGDGKNIPRRRDRRLKPGCLGCGPGARNSGQKHRPQFRISIIRILNPFSPHSASTFRIPEPAEVRVLTLPVKL
jgi:threonine/homoserine/homoserine lactone efflux protein